MNYLFQINLISWGNVYLILATKNSHLHFLMIIQSKNPIQLFRKNPNASTNESPLDAHFRFVVRQIHTTNQMKKKWIPQSWNSQCPKCVRDKSKFNIGFAILNQSNITQSSHRLINVGRHAFFDRPHKEIT